MRCADDPQRRGRVVQATLDAVIAHGIHRVTHRKIAMIAEVPLGSMTYCSSRIDELLIEALGCLTDGMMLQHQDFSINVRGMSQACHVITDIIYGSQVTAPDNTESICQSYTFANREPMSKMVMQNWILHSQQTLEQWFDPVMVQALDALIEGMALHFVTDRKPLQREDIPLMVGRIVGVPATTSCVQRLR